MDIEFLKLAQLELDDAFEYYESELRGLGYKFQIEVKNSIKRILTNLPDDCSLEDVQYQFEEKLSK